MNRLNALGAMTLAGMFALMLVGLFCLFAVKCAPVSIGWVTRLCG